METDRDTQRMIGVAFGGLAPVAVAMALVLVRDQMLGANVALVLTLVVVGAGALGGRMAGATAAVMAAVSYDFFHTRPYLSLTIDSGDDLETTGLLLLVGLAVGTLARRLRSTDEELAEGRSELARLSRVGDRLSRGDDPAEVIFAVQSELTELLGLARCSFEAAPATGAPAATLERSGAITGAGRVHHLTRSGGFELPADGVELPVLSGGRPVGRFVLVPTPGVGATLEARVVAVALADQVGAALAARPVHPAVSPLSTVHQRERGF